MTTIQRSEIDEHWAHSGVVVTGDYPARKAYETKFIRDDILFQVDAIAWIKK